MAEVWKPVVGFESRYEVSDLGRVRSLPKVIIYDRRSRAGRSYTSTFHRKGRLLCLRPHHGGHRTVLLDSKKTVYVHALVLEAFAGPRPSRRHQCRHLNGKPSDNHLVNLKWGTRRENNLDRKWHDWRCKLKPSDIITIRQLYEAGGVSQRTLAKRFKVHPNTIGRVASREIHADV